MVKTSVLLYVTCCSLGYYGVGYGLGFRGLGFKVYGLGFRASGEFKGGALNSPSINRWNGLKGLDLNFKT